MRRGWAVLVLFVAGCIGADPAQETESSPTEGTGATVGPSDSSLPTTGADETAASSCDDREASVAAIFADSCADAGCHGADAAASLDLVSGDWPTRLIGQPSALCEGWIRVVPGDPAASMLADKLHEGPDCGEPMPLGGALAPGDVDCIEQWIMELPPIDCETCGGEACIDTSTDANHCGGCDAACPGGVGCSAGSCACPGGTMACGGACVDPLADGEHCGACNTPCEGGTVCLAGACVADCGALTECGGGCVDTDSHTLHCGGCDSPCEAGGSCNSGTCDCPGDPVSYAVDIEPLFTAGCTAMGCHGFPLPQEGLDLRAGSGHADLVDVPAAQCPDRMLAAPGQPSQSYLMDKLTGTNLCLGTQMPKGAPSWPPDQIALIASWICQGAPP